MAEDLVPGLLEEIRKEFRRGYEGSSKARRLLKKVQDGTATYEEAQEYAREVQRITGAAWEKCVSSGTLPEGRMYYNIASRLVPSQLDGNYELVSGYAQQVQQGINDRSGIGLKALRAEPDQDRVDGLVELAANAEDYDSVAGRLMAGMANYLQHTVDETLRANAAFQYDAGLSPKIVRSVSRPCCKWCAALAGTYEYAQVKRAGHDVWRRHENCDCLIEYVAGSGKRETVGNYRRAKDAQGRRDVAATDDREGRGKRVALARLDAILESQVDKGAKGAIIEDKYDPADIRRAITQRSTNFVIRDINHPDSIFGEVADSIPPIKGFYDIKAHGSPYRVKIFSSAVDASELARIILMRKDYGSEAVRLLSCETGKIENGTCIAMELSRLLGVDVMAPTEILVVSSSGKLTIESSDKEKGWMRLFHPDGSYEDYF